MSHLSTLSDYVGPPKDNKRKMSHKGGIKMFSETRPCVPEKRVQSCLITGLRTKTHTKVRMQKNRLAIERNFNRLRMGGSEEGVQASGDREDVAGRPNKLEKDEDESGWDTELEIEDNPDQYDHSGRKAYIDACRKHGVVPVSYFLRHMNDRELTLRHHQLGAVGVKPIAAALVMNAKVHELDLSDNWLGPEGLEPVCNMLKENCFISHLNLEGNHLGSESAELLCGVLMVTSSLTHVNLSGNGFDDKAAVIFAGAITYFTNIESLDLSHNGFSEVGGVAFGAAISENASLKTLNLSWNSLRRRAAAAIANGIKSNVSMKRINLSWNGFGDDGCKELGKALIENSVLEELCLVNNRITTEGAVLLAKGLLVNETLQSLKMGQNPMQSAGCWAICTAILKNKAAKMKLLDFSGVLVNEDLLSVLKELKVEHEDLVVSYGVSQPAQRPKARIHPMAKLQNYITKHNLKMIEFFQLFDKDGSMSVSREEFVEGLQELGIQLMEEEIQLLLNDLDRSGDGEINYSELVLGSQAFSEREKTSNTGTTYRPATTTAARN